MKDAGEGREIAWDEIGRAQSTWPRVLSKNFCGAAVAGMYSVVWFLLSCNICQVTADYQDAKSKYGKFVTSANTHLSLALVIDSSFRYTIVVSRL